MTSSETSEYKSMDEIRAANDRRGHHFFEPATLRFFGSRVGRTVYGGRYFVTSEQQPRITSSELVHPRRWTVRMVNPDGSIDTVGEFQQYATPGKARVAAQTLGWAR